MSVSVLEKFYQRMHFPLSQNLVWELSCHLKITKTETATGDYRKVPDKSRKLPSMEHLEPQLFSCTCMVLLFAFEKYGGISPHGAEWKPDLVMKCY